MVNDDERDFDEERANEHVLDDERPAGVVVCDSCGQEHEAWPAHVDRFNGAQLYAVVCTVDGLTDYYTAERFVR